MVPGASVVSNATRLRSSARMDRRDVDRRQRAPAVVARRVDRRIGRRDRGRRFGHRNVLGHAARRGEPDKDQRRQSTNAHETLPPVDNLNPNRRPRASRVAPAADSRRIP